MNKKLVFIFCAIFLNQIVVLAVGSDSVTSRVEYRKAIFCVEMRNGLRASQLFDGCDGFIRVSPLIIKYNQTSIVNGYSDTIYCFRQNLSPDETQTYIEYDEAMHFDSFTRLVWFENSFNMGNVFAYHIYHKNNFKQDCNDDNIRYFAIYTMRIGFVATELKEDIIVSNMGIKNIPKMAKKINYTPLKCIVVSVDEVKPYEIK